jgi:hypothetical protein
MDAGLPFVPVNVLRDTGDFAIEHAPAIGSMVSAPFKGVGVTAPLSGMGTALGGLLQKAFTQTGENEPPSSEMEQALMDAGLPTVPRSALGDFATGAGLDAAGSAVVGGIKKAIAPAAGKITQAGREMIDKISQSRAPISPDEYIPGFLPKASRWLADRFYLGQQYMQGRREDLAEYLVNWREGLLKSFPEVQRGTPTEIGTKVSEGILKRGEDIPGMFKKSVENVGGETEIPLENFVQYVNENGGLGAVSAVRDQLKAYTKQALNSEGNMLSRQKIESLLANVWPSGGKKYAALDDASKQYLGGLKESLLLDLAEWDMKKGTDTAALRFAADRAHSEYMSLVKDNAAVKGMLQRFTGEDRPDLALRVLFERGNIKELQQIKKALPADTWDAARFRFFENLFDRSMDQSGTRFFPAKFAQELSRYQNQIEFAFDDILPQIKDFSTIALNAQPDLARAAGDKARAGIMDYATAGSGIASMFGGGDMGSAVTAIALPQGASFLMAWGLMSPKTQWFRNWMASEGNKNVLRGLDLTKEAGKGSLMDAMNERERQKKRPSLTGF